MKTAIACYCIVIGVLMAAWWANDLRQGAWNRGDRTHDELALHLAAEFVTAALLIAAGAAWLAVGPPRTPPGVFPGTPRTAGRESVS